MKAWIQNGKVRDTVQGGPYEKFHKDIAQMYDTEVPDNAANGDSWDGSVLTKPDVTPRTPTEPVIKYGTVSPVEFKLLFTVQERIEIKNLITIDPVVEDLCSILDDPRLTEVNRGLQSTQDSVNYIFDKLVAAGVVTEENKGTRVERVLQGELV